MNREKLSEGQHVVKVQGLDAALGPQTLVDITTGSLLKPHSKIPV